MHTTAYLGQLEIGSFEYIEMFDNYQVRTNAYGISDIKDSVESVEQAKQILRNLVPEICQNEVKFVSLDSLRKEANSILENMIKKT